MCSRRVFTRFARPGSKQPGSTASPNVPTFGRAYAMCAVCSRCALTFTQRVLVLTRRALTQTRCARLRMCWHPVRAGAGRSRFARGVHAIRVTRQQAAGLHGFAERADLRSGLRNVRGVFAMRSHSRNEFSCSRNPLSGTRDPRFADACWHPRSRTRDAFGRHCSPRVTTREPTA
jgi:hypothetical protein